MQTIDFYSDDLRSAIHDILAATELSENEEQLKIQLESSLKEICRKYDIFWNPYTYEHSFESGRHRLDALHGATLIEYEPPKSFNCSENAQLKHAQKQAEEYAVLVSEEEGRALNEYSLIAWDGESISFAKYSAGTFWWESIQLFDEASLERLLFLIASNGKPLVNPSILKQYVGPETDIGKMLLPMLFREIVSAQNVESSNRTNLIFSEWARLFGQVDGESSERLVSYLSQASNAHSIDYLSNPQAYVFALNTYIAIIAKICAALSLAGKDISKFGTFDKPRKFLEQLEEGVFFREYGIENMLSTDFFSWYLGADISQNIDLPLRLLVNKLTAIDFDTSRKTPDSVRDLFKGLYMEFMPASMRHALGEYYTPDWLAAHVLDEINWSIDKSLLDPTCGSGTFILEAIKRRLADAHPKNTAKELLEDIYGIDLNPLAVLTTRASIVVSLANRFDAKQKTLLPVYLGDAINTADPKDGVFTHSILTEKGAKTFAIPLELAESPSFYGVMDQLRICIDSDLDADTSFASIESISITVEQLPEDMKQVLYQTIEVLIELHRSHWNGIWCLILFDRIKAGCIHDIDYVVGNPPWVKWSNLPRPYAEFIKPLCERMDIFSEDAWVGGIQSDISTVVTYHALERFVASGGKLAFLITGTVFKNESSQGFRRWELSLPGSTTKEPVSVLEVEDYKCLRPFENVANWPMLLVIERNCEKTKYPISYKFYNGPTFAKRHAFDKKDYTSLHAIPIPGTIDGPWLVGRPNDIEFWPQLFDVSSNASYIARKGVTTDANGIYFVHISEEMADGNIHITNDPSLGRRKDIIKTNAVVEGDNIFPLLRGRDITRFNAFPQDNSYVIVPQRGMSGDAQLPMHSPRLFRYLSNFKNILETRSSYKRFQEGKPFWSVWSTGSYTFAPYKVVWKEMSGSNFACAYVAESRFTDDSFKVIVPDHKVYFIPLESEDEAAYLTCYLNSSLVASAINAYSSDLSLGTSIVEYLFLPKYDESNEIMSELANMGKKYHYGAKPTNSEEELLNNYVATLIADK